MEEPREKVAAPLLSPRRGEMVGDVLMGRMMLEDEKSVVCAEGAGE